MPMNMRLDPTDKRFFSPDRDLAYCFPHLAHRAFVGLDPGKREEWVEMLLVNFNLSDDDLCKTATVFAEYMNKAVLDPQYKQPYDALKAVGFFDLPVGAQALICAKIGQIMLSAFFSSIRDITRDPRDPPMDATKMTQALDEFLLKFQKPVDLTTAAGLAAGAAVDDDWDDDDEDDDYEDDDYIYDEDDDEEDDWDDDDEDLDDEDFDDYEDDDEEDDWDDDDEDLDDWTEQKVQGALELPRQAEEVVPCSEASKPRSFWQRLFGFGKK